MKTPPLKDWTFEDVVDYACAYILKQFIAEGGKGFRNAIWLMLNLAIDWRYPRTNKKLDNEKQSA